MSPKRKSPIRHGVRDHTKRNGTKVRTHTRGQGEYKKKPSKVVKRVMPNNKLSELEDMLEFKEWGVDTEYAHGEPGAISIAPIWKGRGIGPDRSFSGTVAELLEDLKPGGELYEFLKANNYSTKLTSVDASELTSHDRAYLNEYGRVHKVDMNLNDGYASPTKEKERETFEDAFKKSRQTMEDQHKRARSSLSSVHTVDTQMNEQFSSGRKAFEELFKKSHDTTKEMTKKVRDNK